VTVSTGVMGSSSSNVGRFTQLSNFLSPVSRNRLKLGSKWGEFA